MAFLEATRASSAERKGAVGCGRGGGKWERLVGFGVWVLGRRERSSTASNELTFARRSAGESLVRIEVELREMSTRMVDEICIVICGEGVSLGRCDDSG